MQLPLFPKAAECPSRKSSAIPPHACRRQAPPCGDAVPHRPAGGARGGAHGAAVCPRAGAVCWAGLHAAVCSAVLRWLCEFLSLSTLGAWCLQVTCAAFCVGAEQPAQGQALPHCLPTVLLPFCTSSLQASKQARHLTHPQLCLDAIQYGVEHGGRAGLVKVLPTCCCACAGRLHGSSAAPECRLTSCVLLADCLPLPALIDDQQEGECFKAAAALDTHKALVHIFFAQRSTKKIRGEALVVVCKRCMGGVQYAAHFHCCAAAGPCKLNPGPLGAAVSKACPPECSTLP